MKEAKLLRLSEYVIIQKELLQLAKINSNQFAANVIRYTLFLQTPLELKRFVACDKRTGIPFPKFEYCCGGGMQDQCGCMGMPINVHPKELEEYEEALKDVWFTGFTCDKSIYDGIYSLRMNDKFWDTIDLKEDKLIFVRRSTISTIELLYKENVYLTPSKSKDLGLTTE